MAAGHWPRWAESGVRPAVRRVDASEAVRRTAHSTDRWGGSEARPWGIEASGGDLNLAGSGALAAYGERRDQKARRPLAETRSPATGAKPSHQRPLLVGPIKPPTGTCPARRVTDCPWPDVSDGTRPSTPSSANRGSVPRDLSGCSRQRRRPDPHRGVEVHVYATIPSTRALQALPLPTEPWSSPCRSASAKWLRRGRSRTSSCCGSHPR